MISLLPPSASPAQPITNSRINSSELTTPEVTLHFQGDGRAELRIGKQVQQADDAVNLSQWHRIVLTLLPQRVTVTIDNLTVADVEIAKTVSVAGLRLESRSAKTEFRNLRAFDSSGEKTLSNFQD